MLDDISGLFSGNLERAGTCSPHGQKTALVALSGTPALLCAQLEHWWRFSPPGFPTCFYNTPCRIDRGGYVDESSEPPPFLTDLGLRVFFLLRGTGKYRINRELGSKRNSVL